MLWVFSEHSICIDVCTCVFLSVCVVEAERTDEMSLHAECPDCSRLSQTQRGLYSFVFCHFPTSEQLSAGIFLFVFQCLVCSRVFVNIQLSAGGSNSNSSSHDDDIGDVVVAVRRHCQSSAGLYGIDKFHEKRQILWHGSKFSSSQKHRCKTFRKKIKKNRKR